MNIKIIFGWIVAYGFSFVVGWTGYHLGSQLGGVDGSWLALLLGFLSMGFFIEVMKVRLGKQLFWNLLGVRDKIVFTISMILLFGFFLYPRKEGGNSIIEGVSPIIGLLLSWVTVFLFASKEGRKILLPFMADIKPED